jgi:hypothetical protein
MTRSRGIQGLSNRNGGARAPPFAWMHESYGRPASFVLASIIFAPHALHRIPPESRPVSDLPAQGERTVREQVYAGGSGHSKSFGLQPQLLRALAVAGRYPVFDSATEVWLKLG